MKSKLKSGSFKLVLILTSFLMSQCTGRKERLNKSEFFLGLSSRYSGDSIDTNGFKLFSKVPFFHENQKNAFTRIGNEMLTVKDTKFQLFFFQDNKLSFAGYWGERNDSIMFIPYGTMNCPIEYLIVHWGHDGFFKIDESDPCFNEVSTIVNDSYFYRILSVDSLLTRMNHFISPDERTDISEIEHLEWAIPLSISLHKVRGILDIKYDFDLNEQRVVPWISEAVGNACN